VLRLSKLLTLFFVIVSFSCNINNITDEGVTGRVNISIPKVTPLLSEALSSRGFFKASRVEITVFSSSTEVLTKTVDNVLDSTAPIYINLEQGAYTIKMEIFNTNISETVPVVSGISEEFVISPGVETSVHLKLTPENPVSVTLGSEFTIIPDQYTVFNGSSTTNIGDEYWYSFDAVSDITTIKVMGNDLLYSPAVVFVYDVSGTKIKINDFSIGNIAVNTVLGSTYFVCIAPLKVSINSTDYFQSEISILINEATADANNSVDTALPILQDVDYSGIIESDTDFDYYSIDLIGGKTYSIENLFDKVNITKDNSFTGTVLLSGTNRLIINPDSDQTMIFSVNKNSSSTGVPYIYSLKVTEVVSLPKNIMNDLNLPDYQVNYFYQFDVDPSKTYTLKWDDSYSGSGSYTSDVSVTAKSSSGTLFCSSKDSGYSTLDNISITLSLGEDKIYLIIYTQYKSGTLGVELLEN